MTLARYFLKLCADADLSNMREIARRAGIDPATPWKIKHGRPVRAKTLGLVLRALDLTPKDASYREAFAIWGEETIGRSGGPAMAAGAAKRALAEASESAKRGVRSIEAKEMLETFAQALRRIPQGQWPELRKVLDEPASLVHWLKSRG